MSAAAPVVTIGLTRSDRRGADATGYCCFVEGYLAGAAQDTFDVEVPGAASMSVEALGWLVFRATNDPAAESAEGAAGDLARQVAPLRNTRMRSFSTGDTVTVGSTSMALSTDGFVEVQIAPADQEVLAESLRQFWAARR